MFILMYILVIASYNAYLEFSNSLLSLLAESRNLSIYLTTFQHPCVWQNSLMFDFHVHIFTLVNMDVLNSNILIRLASTRAGISPSAGWVKSPIVAWSLLYISDSSEISSGCLFASCILLTLSASSILLTLWLCVNQPLESFSLGNIYCLLTH